VNIAFLHYHLKTGGVTTVLLQQLSILKSHCNIMVFSGEPPDKDFPFEVHVMPGLAYDSVRDPSLLPNDIANSIYHIIQSRWPHGCDVLHVHNPILAKNSIYLDILNSLKNQFNIKLFLQVHDFAEDGRPHAYYSDPYIADCHYGTINSRDYQILLNAGLSSHGLHLLSNTVSEFTPKNNCLDLPPFILYPVRGMRRKNIGEAILLSLFFKEKELLCITRPPNSLLDIQQYEKWKEFTKDRQCNVMFDAGLHYDFVDLFAHAKFTITTSITEGFGFAFLEPWMASKMLFGRNLPGITQDFINNDVMLDHLYSQLNIPIQWFDHDRFYHSWTQCMKKTAEQFHLSLPQEDINQAFAKISHNNLVDFGLLDELNQKQVIDIILTNPNMATKLCQLNPQLSQLELKDAHQSLIQTNKHIVSNRYHSNYYLKKLLNIYQSVIQTPVTQKIDKSILLKQFFQPNSFSLLKWRNDGI